MVLHPLFEEFCAWDFSLILSPSTSFTLPESLGGLARLALARARSSSRYLSLLHAPPALYFVFIARSLSLSLSLPSLPRSGTCWDAARGRRSCRSSVGITERRVLVQEGARLN